MRQCRLIKIALVSMLAAILLNGGCQFTPPGEPEGQLLVILSERGEPGHYELIDLQGRRRDISRTLGVADTQHRAAIWSPAGDRVAYTGGVDGDEHLVGLPFYQHL